jgi:outer membrane protein
MKLKTNFLFIVALLLAMGSTSAQKIGHANLELLLNYMPETKAMNQTLSTYESSLSKTLSAKQQLGQSKLTEYQSLEKTPQNEARLKQLETELTSLDQEIQKESRDAESKLMQKRQELLTPITQKIQDAIDALSKEEGYDYILNTVDSSGVSIILKGPEEHDLTRKLGTRLGIAFPEN